MLNIQFNYIVILIKDNINIIRTFYESVLLLIYNENFVTGILEATVGSVNDSLET